MIRGSKKKLGHLKPYQGYFERLAGVESMEFGPDLEKPREAATVLVEDMEVFVPLGGLIDLDMERERMTKEMKRLEKMVQGLRLKLANTEFIQKAPQDVVEKEQRKLTDFQEKLHKLKSNLKALGS